MVPARHIRIRLAALAILAALPPLFAHAQETAPSASAAVRLANFAGGAPFRVLLDGRQVWGILAPSDVTGYLLVPAGPHRLALVSADAGRQAGSPLPAVSLGLAAGTFHTLIALPGGPEDEGPVVQDLTDDLGAVPPPGHALLRVVHAARSQPALSVSLAPGQGREASPLAELEPLNTTGYLAVPAGEWRLQVVQRAEARVLLDVPDLVLSAGTVVTLFLADGQNGLRARITIDALVDAAGPAP